MAEGDRFNESVTCFHPAAGLLVVTVDDGGTQAYDVQVPVVLHPSRQDLLSELPDVSLSTGSLSDELEVDFGRAVVLLVEVARGGDNLVIRMDA